MIISSGPACLFWHSPLGQLMPSIFELVGAKRQVVEAVEERAADAPVKRRRGASVNWGWTSSGTPMAGFENDYYSLQCVLLAFLLFPQGDSMGASNLIHPMESFPTLSESVKVPKFPFAVREDSRCLVRLCILCVPNVRCLTWKRLKP